jgi:hypothetical protein
MKKHGVCFTAVLVLSMLIVAGFASYAYSQERLSDKDIETMFNNLKSDAKKFSSTFNSAVGKSTIRKTSQEKEAKALVQSFGTVRSGTGQVQEEPASRCRTLQPAY